MLQLDKVLLVFNNKYLTSINTRKFTTSTVNETVKALTFSQSKPFSLRIKVNPEQKEATIEFTGKILTKNYPMLISKQTIRECLANIQNLGLCQLDIDKIIKTADVPKIDVTKDITTDFEECVSVMELALKNTKRWDIAQYQGSHGRIFRKNVKSKSCQRRLIVYNKDKELTGKDNQEFLAATGRSSAIVNYFVGRVRFEVNLNCKAQIRELLQIPDTKLTSVLASTANPILAVVDEAFDFSQSKQRGDNMQEALKMLLLEKCDYDLAKVEKFVRQHSSKKTSIKKAMQPFRDLLSQHKGHRQEPIDIRRLLIEG